MKTETRRGLVAAGAALIALVTLAILSPTPQLAIYWLVTTYFPSTPPGPMAVTAGAIGAQVAGAATDALMALVPESLSLGAAIGLGIGIGLASFGIGFVAA